ncbi:hypothetical protein MKX01_004713, partial [Papaver californicum]
DGKAFISAEDLKVNLWNLEICDQCYKINCMDPSSMEDLTDYKTEKLRDQKIISPI